jgi:hypothetical protein
MKYKNRDYLADKFLNPQLKAVKKILTSAKVRDGQLYINSPVPVEVTDQNWASLIAAQLEGETAAAETHNPEGK